MQYVLCIEAEQQSQQIQWQKRTSKGLSACINRKSSKLLLSTKKKKVNTRSSRVQNCGEKAYTSLLSLTGHSQPGMNWQQDLEWLQVQQELNNLERSKTKRNERDETRERHEEKRKNKREKPRSVYLTYIPLRSHITIIRHF